MTDVLVPPRPAVRTPAPSVQRPLALATALWTLATLSVLALWFVGYVLVVGAAQEQGDQQRLFARFRSQLSQGTAPVGPTAEGRPVALIEAPRAGLRRAVVVEGTSSRDLQSGPGHRRDSVLPGQAGICVLYGKGVTFGAPFNQLGHLAVGDQITVTTGQGTFDYAVTGRRRPGDVLPPQLAPGSGRLTLVSTVATGWRLGLAANATTYVDAVLDKGQPSTGRVGVPSADEKLLASSAEALLPLVLWLEALLAVVVVGVWAGARWGRWQTWLVVSPALAAVLVATSRVAATLLPNLF